MASDHARELRQQGIAAAKAGRKDDARQLLQQSIRIEPNSEAAWLWLASVARDQRERQFCLQKILEINPGNSQARQALAAIDPSAAPPVPDAPQQMPRGIKPIQRAPTRPENPFESASNAPFTDTAEEAPKPQPTLPTGSGSRGLSEADILNQAPGVPMPSADRIAEAQQQAEAMIREFQQPLPSDIKWVHKTKRRAGEGDVNVLRAQIAGGVLGFAIILLILGGVVLATNADAQYIVFGPSATPSPSPTITPTNTPGVTPTPSPVPAREFTSTPVPPANLVPANPFVPLQATDIYPPMREGNVLESAVNIMNRGDFNLAIPTFRAERETRDSSTFSPNAFYYEALAHAESGNFADAFEVLDAANELMTGRTPNNERALIQSGYAQVYWKAAQERIAGGSITGQTIEDLINAVENAEIAALNDPRLADPYLVLAQISEADRGSSQLTLLLPEEDRLLAESQLEMFETDRRLRDAIDILDEALLVDQLSNNTRLLIEKGKVAFGRGNFGEAGYQAYLALFVDPTIEEAYRLSILSSLAQNKPGDAVMQANTYTFYYPGSSTAYRLLGDARLAEGNPDLALVAYSQAAQGGTPSEQASALQARAQLLTSMGDYSAAREDLTAALRLDNQPAIHAARLVAALNEGRYSIAQDDIEALRRADFLPENTLNLLEGRVLIDGAYGSANAPECDDDATAAFSRALTLLNPLSLSGTAENRALANEYLARAHYCLGDLDSAYNAILQAMNASETPGRHYWRARIAEALGNNWQAARDYEWLLSWSGVAPITIPEDTTARLAELPEATRRPIPEAAPESEGS